MVDLHRQYLGIRDEVDRAIGDVIAETAFIKGPAVGLFEVELARRLEVRAARIQSLPPFPAQCDSMQHFSQFPGNPGIVHC